MKRIIREFASKPEHRDCDACFVIVMSLGYSNSVFSSDNLTIETEWILTQFNNEHSPALREKAKVFIFQSCRGDQPCPGVEMDTDHVAFPFDRRPEFSNNLMLDGASVRDKGKRMAAFTDMLIAYATVPGKEACPAPIKLYYRLSCLPAVYS